MIDDERLCACLAAHWGLADATVEVHNGGMNSATWFVSAASTRRGAGGSPDRRRVTEAVTPDYPQRVTEAATPDSRRWVAKAVTPGSRRAFVGGLRVATAVEASGIPAGAPVPTTAGALVVDVDGVPLALLRWVPGAGLSTQDQALIGRVLAAVHRKLVTVSVDGGDRFHWVDPRAAHLAVRPWVRRAVTAALEPYGALPPGTLTWGSLHTDPAPEAFRLDRRTGVCGLIDWSVAMTGPLLYDLASAVMYVGGPGRADRLVDAYLADGPLGRAEVDRGLAAMVTLRWAVQADYFARRIFSNDLTGIAGASDNEKGLADARQWLDA